MWLLHTNTPTHTHSHIQKYTHAYTHTPANTHTPTYIPTNTLLHTHSQHTSTRQITRGTEAHLHPPPAPPPSPQQTFCQWVYEGTFHAHLARSLCSLLTPSYWSGTTLTSRTSAIICLLLLPICMTLTRQQYNLRDRVRLGLTTACWKTSMDKFNLKVVEKSLPIFETFQHTFVMKQDLFWTTTKSGIGHRDW